MPGKNIKTKKMTNAENCTVIPKTNLEKKVRQKIDNMSKQSLPSDLVLKNKKLFAFVKKVCVKLPKLNENKITKSKLSLPRNRPRPKSLNKPSKSSLNEGRPASKSPGSEKASIPPSDENTKSKSPTKSISESSSADPSISKSLVEKAKPKRSSSENIKSKKSPPSKSKSTPSPTVEKSKSKSPSDGKPGSLAKETPKSKSTPSPTVEKSQSQSPSDGKPGSLAKETPKSKSTPSPTVEKSQSKSPSDGKPGSLAKETPKSKDGPVKEKSKKSTSPVADSGNTKDTPGRKRKNADQASGPKNKKSVDTPIMKKIFIRLPLMTGKGNKINKAHRTDRKIKPLSTRTEPSYLDRDKNAPIKKLGRTYLSDKFGSIYLRCHVKLKRLASKDSVDLLVIPKVKKIQSRKSVSFVETVEVFGDSDIEYEDDENETVEPIETGIEMSEDTATDVDGGKTDENKTEDPKKVEESSINIADNEKDKELDNQEDACESEQPDIVSKLSNKGKSDLDPKNNVMTTIHAEGFSHVTKVKKISERRLTTLDFDFERAADRNISPSVESNKSTIPEKTKDTETDLSKETENSVKTTEQSNSSVANVTDAKEQTQSSEYERLNGTNEESSDKNKNDNSCDEPNDSAGFVRTFEEQESDDDIRDTSKNSPIREVDEEELNTSEPQEQVNDKVNLETVEKEISDNESKLLNETEEDRDERENNVTEETITATRIEHNESDKEDCNEEHQEDDEEELDKEKVEKEIEKDEEKQTNDSEKDKDIDVDRDIEKDATESNKNQDNADLMTDDEEQIEEHTESRPASASISKSNDETEPLTNSQLKDIFNDENMFDLEKNKPGEIGISQGTSSSCQDKLIYSSDDESNDVDVNMMSDITKIENQLKELGPTSRSTSNMALYDKSPLTTDNDITLNAAVSETTPTKLSNISTSSSEEDQLTYSELNTNKNLTKTTSESLNLNDTAAPSKNDDSNFSLNNLFRSIRNKLTPGTESSKSLEKDSKTTCNLDDDVVGDTDLDFLDIPDELLSAPLVDDVSSGIAFSQNVDDIMLS